METAAYRDVLLSLRERFGYEDDQSSVFVSALQPQYAAARQDAEIQPTRSCVCDPHHKVCALAVVRRGGDDMEKTEQPVVPFQKISDACKSTGLLFMIYRITLLKTSLETEKTNILYNDEDIGLVIA